MSNVFGLKFMSSTEHQKLLQLKINYLNYMKQVLNWNEPNLTSILFALLMERDYLTQDDLIKLTGLSRAAVSETLTTITSTNSIYPVLKTKKPNDKKNYYYCPMDFEHYMQALIANALETTDVNIQYLPELIARIDSLKNQNSKASHIRKILVFYLSVTIYYKEITQQFKDEWKEFLKDELYKTKIDEKLSLLTKQLDDEMDKIDYPKVTIANDSIENIERDFIEKSIESQNSLGRRRELSTILHTLILESDPITQDDIINLTGYSRSTISESLGFLVKANIVSIVKKPKDRKKYFKQKLNLSEYSATRFQMALQAISRIETMIRTEFIPALKQLNIPENQKKHYNSFFLQNIDSYNMMRDYMSIFFEMIFALWKNSKYSIE